MEISGLLSSGQDNQLEGTVFQIIEKMDVKMDHENVEACHWLLSNKSFKKVITKLSKRKNADKIREVKKKINSLKLESMTLTILSS